MKWLKFLVLLVLAAVVVGFFASGLHTQLTLESFKAQQTDFQLAFENNPVGVVAAYFGVYVVMTALSLPGATLLTLAGGALFGLGLGFVIISFASTLGATAAFLLSRFVLRDWVQKRFADKLTAINTGVQKEGGFYLFTLRLVPLFPFFVVNLVMGLTPIKTWTYYWVSQLGMLAGTLVYVNAGTQLGQLNSLSGILSPEILGSFVLLGIFPWLAKGLQNRIQQARIYKGFKKPKRFDRNLIVIGAGAGGLVTSYIAAAVKAKVTLIENHKMGGDCLNTGCVPSKALIRSAKFLSQIDKARSLGMQDAQATFDFRDIMARVHRVIKTVEPHDSIERYTSLGVEVKTGYAKLLDPWTVEVRLHNGQTETLTARHIVLATGARPFVPSIAGLDLVAPLTSDTLWNLREQPDRLLVLGAGPIGCELAQAFARLDTQVTLLERSERLMQREDLDVSEQVHATFEKEGVRVLTRTQVERFAIEEGVKVAYVGIADAQGGVSTQRIEFDQVLIALGRSANLSGYGLEALGLASGNTLETNEHLQTRFPNIYAVGDVTGPYQFTHVAAHQAWYAAVNSLFGRFKRFKVDYRVIPRTTFTDPEVARVGLNEREAQAQGVAYEISHYGLDDLDRAIADEAAHGWVKVLTVPGKDTILGVTIVGDHAGDLLAEFVLAMKHGLGLNKILGTIHAYPTWAEANKYAAGVWKKAHAPQGLLRWVEKFHAWSLK